VWGQQQLDVLPQICIITAGLVEECPARLRRKINGALKEFFKSSPQIWVHASYCRAPENVICHGRIPQNHAAMGV
jgi:hypothetical protein